MAIAFAATGVGSAWAEAASAQGLRQWRFGTARHLPDSRTARISDGDYFSGRARFIDTYVAASRQRFRNSRRGPRKRVYLIRGTLAIKNKPGFDVLGAECSQKSPRGTNMLLTTQGARAFFPRPANHIEQRTSEGSVGLSVKGFSVSLPFSGVHLLREHERRPERPLELALVERAQLDLGLGRRSPQRCAPGLCRLLAGAREAHQVRGSLSRGHRQRRRLSAPLLEGRGAHEAEGSQLISGTSSRSRSGCSVPSGPLSLTECARARQRRTPRPGY